MSGLYAIGLLVAIAFLLAANAVSAQGPVMALHAADARGRAFDLTALRGNVVAVTFVSRYTQDEGARVNATEA